MDGSLGPAVRRADADGVATLTLDRPASRNALSLSMLDSLHAALAAIAAEDGVRAVVLAAEGPAFSAGHDLREITAHRADADGGAGFYAHVMARCSELMQAIVALPQPVIAAVRGIATAAGCQLVAACDLAVAGRSARFATPGVNIGLFCSTPAVALGRAVPPKAAAEMLLTGEMIDAEEARRIFLVNRVVEDDQVLAAAHALARGIAARSAVTVRLGKAGYARQMAQPLHEAYATASAVMVENLLTEDAQEGIGAFLAKRHPSWRHR
jgi:enoyl-CoA hydratase/carnithine racemase